MLIIKTSKSTISLHVFDYLMSNGDTALILAAIKGDEAIITTLIKHGASVDRQNKYTNTFIEDFDYMMRRRKTALTIAVESGHESIVTLLIKSGASVDHQSQ